MKNEIKISEIIKLIRVRSLKDHEGFLYQLLKKRKANYSISHSELPTLKNHKKFISKNPYRYWFIIELQEKFVGSAYISKNNSIAIHLMEERKKIYEEVLLFFNKNIKPLKEIPSIRSREFIINLSINNKFYANIIKKLGGEKIQETYSLKNEKK